MSTTPRTLVTEGFDSFRRGTFGNAGHNLYVSRGGVLQRIHQYDLDGDGYIDLVFSNSHDYWETAPSDLWQWNGNAFSRREITTQGARCAAIADLTGDGVPDLVIGRQFDGVGFDVNAIVYYGTDRGWGEHAVQYLPAPGCTAVAVGDFNGDGRPDLAFLLATSLRVFTQTELAFEPKAFVDLPISGQALEGADLDGDGCAELVVRGRDGGVRIYWGSPNGLDAERWTELRASVGGAADGGSAAHFIPAAEALVDVAGPPVARPQVVVLDGVPHLFAAGPEEFTLVPIRRDRSAGTPLTFHVPGALAVAIADLDGDGADDLVVAAGESGAWIGWGGPDGLPSGSGPVAGDAPSGGAAAHSWLHLPVERACDVAIGDLDGDGRLELAVAAFHDADSFTVQSPILRFAGRTASVWQAIETHDPRSVAVVDLPDAPRSLFVLNRYGRSLADRGSVYVYPGGPDGYDPARRRTVESWGACVSVCADLDDDGRVDLVIANAAESDAVRAPGSFVYRNTGPGFEPVFSQLLPPHQAHGLACADLDRDGYLDLVLATMDQPEIVIVHGGPDGFDIEHPERIRLEIDGETYLNQRFIQLVDLNGDGWLDLFVPMIDAPHSLLLWGGPNGFSVERSQRLSVWHPCSAHAADLDGDGRPELIVGGHSASPTGPHDSFVYIYWNGPDGLREDRRTLLPGEAVNSIAVADFNNDGRLDLYVGSYQDGRKRRDIDSYIYWNRAGRGFTAADVTRLPTHSASGDFAADLNEDGWVDLVVANHKTYGDHVGDSTIWWNGPDGFDPRRVTNLPTRGPHGTVTPGPGNLLDRGAEEFYESEPFELADGERVTALDWEAALGPKTWVRAQLRVATSPADLAGAAWGGTTGLGSWFERGDPVPQPSSGPWVQYRLALGATNSGSTPRVSKVTVTIDQA